MGQGNLPAVRTVFFMDCIIRLSPEACSRTLVRSSGLDHRAEDVRSCRLVAGNRRRNAHWVIDAAIVAATPGKGEILVSEHSCDRS